MKRFRFLALFAVLSLSFALTPGTSAQTYASRSERSYENTHLRVAVQGGWGYRTARLSEDIDPALRDHMRRLKSGYVIGADAAWYVANMGFGATYHTLHSFDNAGKVKTQDATAASNLTEEIGIMYVAPQLSSRYVAGKHNMFIDISLGYLSYRNHTFQGLDYRVNGKTLGYGADLRYDYAITPRFAVGASFTAVTGTLRKVRIGVGSESFDQELEKGEYESLNHIALTAGIRFML